MYVHEHRRTGQIIITPVSVPTHHLIKPYDMARSHPNWVESRGLPRINMYKSFVMSVSLEFMQTQAMEDAFTWAEYVLSPLSRFLHPMVR
jgi:hypothetical protein